MRYELAILALVLAACADTGRTKIGKDTYQIFAFTQGLRGRVHIKGDSFLHGSFLFLPI